MPTKKKCTVLNIQQRLNVLKDLQEALPVLEIGKKYGIDSTTVYRIRKNAAKISALADKSKRDRKRQRIKLPVYHELDKDLLEWFMEKRALRVYLTDVLMLKKAQELKDNLPSCSHSKVSYGWLAKFKKRHGIRLIDMHGEKASADQDGADIFVDDFKKMIEEENINLENIYNMGESGLLWKALPTKTATGDEETNSGANLRKDRITIGLCANALGTHKIMPLVIYPYKNPKALKHEVSLSVIFRTQVNAWMDRAIFLDWFEHHFKPCVQKYQAEKQISGKVILLLDNCEGHKISPGFQEDDDFKIVYLPPNTTSLIQPINQGIIEKTKRLFRHKLLQRVLTYENGITEFYKDYTLKNCIDTLSISWSEITENNIRNAWNKLIGTNIPPSRVQSTVEIEPDWEYMISVIKEEDCTEQHVTEFLSECEEIERKDVHEQIKKGNHCTREPTEEPCEIIYRNISETERKDISQQIEEGNDCKMEFVEETSKIIYQNMSEIGRKDVHEQMEEANDCKMEPIEEPSEIDYQDTSDTEGKDVEEQIEEGNDCKIELVDETSEIVYPDTSEIERRDGHEQMKKENECNVKGTEVSRETIDQDISERERKDVHEQIEEEIDCKEEPTEEPHQIIYQNYNNENVRNELHQIFEQLTLYSARAPTCIQYMIQGLKIFFLGEEH
ncbi:hypothetical protein KM043_011166 [Ampulex compressa]|nr:hypothetical protein KM043_011166 [Ampulex compressa]